MCKRLRPMPVRHSKCPLLPLLLLFVRDRRDVLTLTITWICFLFFVRVEGLHRRTTSTLQSVSTCCLRYCRRACIVAGDNIYRRSRHMLSAVVRAKKQNKTKNKSKRNNKQTKNPRDDDDDGDNMMIIVFIETCLI